MFDQIGPWLEAKAHLIASRLEEHPTEVWNGHAVYTTVCINDSGPTSVTVEIEVVAPASLFVRKRPIFRWTIHRLPLINLANVDAKLETRGDSAAFARQLFDDKVAAATIPLALKSGEWLEVTPNKVRVCRDVIDQSEKDATGAARALAMAVVSALKLPPPPTSAPSALPPRRT